MSTPAIFSDVSRRPELASALQRLLLLNGATIVNPVAFTDPLGASVNDLNPSGAAILRVDANGTTLTGVAGGQSGRVLHIVNVGAGTLTFAHQNAGSEPENRIITRSGAGFMLGTNGTISLVYDDIDGRWRLLPDV